MGFPSISRIKIRLLTFACQTGHNMAQTTFPALLYTPPAHKHVLAVTYLYFHSGNAVHLGASGTLHYFLVPRMLSPACRVPSCPTTILAFSGWRGTSQSLGLFLIHFQILSTQPGHCLVQKHFSGRTNIAAEATRGGECVRTSRAKIPRLVEIGHRK